MEIQTKTQSIESSTYRDFANQNPDLRSNLFSLKKKNITRPVEVLSERKSNNVGLEKLKILRILSSHTTDTLLVRWVLRSSGRRAKIIQFLFHKWLFSNLNRKEFELFIELPEIMRDNMIFSALKARGIGYPLKSIRSALKLSSSLLFGKKAPTVERWNGYKTFSLEIEKEIVQRPKRAIVKYSGWKRHQNDHGSLGPPKEDPFYSEPLIENDNISIFLQIVKEINNRKSEIIINNFIIRRKP